MFSYCRCRPHQIWSMFISMPCPTFHLWVLHVQYVLRSVFNRMKSLRDNNYDIIEEFFYVNKIKICAMMLCKYYSTKKFKVCRCRLEKKLINNAKDIINYSFTELYKKKVSSFFIHHQHKTTKTFNIFVNIFSEKNSSSSHSDFQKKTPEKNFSCVLSEIFVNEKKNLFHEFVGVKLPRNFNIWT